MMIEVVMMEKEVNLKHMDVDSLRLLKTKHLQRKKKISQCLQKINAALGEKEYETRKTT